MDLTDKTIFITGGTSGIGLALAKEFLNLENTVIVCGRNLSKLKKVNETYPGINTIQCDISRKEAALRALNLIQTRFGNINLLVNNAGVQYQYQFIDDDNSLEKIEDEIDINFKSLVRLTKMVLPTMITQSETGIVNISSGLGIVPKKSAAVYCATKAAVHVFSKSLRYQLENTTVKIFDVLPPTVDTPMTRGRKESEHNISSESVAKEVIYGLKKNKYEMKIGQVKLLSLMNRIWPSLVERSLKKR